MAKRTGMTNAQKIEHYPFVEKQLNRTDLMLSDVMNGRVTYGPWVSDGECGKYRVGISRESCYPICMVIFRYPGQSDSVLVYDLEPYEVELRRLRNHSECHEPVCQALALAKDAVRAKAA